MAGRPHAAATPSGRPRLGLGAGRGEAGRGRAHLERGRTDHCRRIPGRPRCAAPDDRAGSAPGRRSGAPAAGGPRRSGPRGPAAREGRPRNPERRPAPRGPLGGGLDSGRAVDAAAPRPRRPGEGLRPADRGGRSGDGGGADRSASLGVRQPGVHRGEVARPRGRAGLCRRPLPDRLRRPGQRGGRGEVWSAGPGKPSLLEPVGVHADHRGRGFGTAISVAAAAVLRELGASSALVSTPTSNTAAVAAAYQAAGYEPSSERLDVSRAA